MKEIRFDVKTRPVELGYELRCIAPKAFDLMYCSLLGIGVKMLFDQGHTGCMVTSNERGDVKPLQLKDMEDPKTGKIGTRMVNIDGSKAQIIMRCGMHFITSKDYESAKQYVANPEEFDFYKILNWGE